MAASTSGARDVLRSTKGKENYQRLTRLLIAGGTRLLRELFDKRRPPGNLDIVLNASERKALLKAKLTKPQRDILYPEHGEQVSSKDWDISLLFKLLTSICDLTPKAANRAELPEDGDPNRLKSDLDGIRSYRNTIYGHVNESMELTDEKFQSSWREISEALVRIASEVGKKQEWSKAIKEFLRGPLTPEDEELVEADRKAWYNDGEVKKGLTDLKDKMGQINTRLQHIQREQAVNSQKVERVERKVDDINNKLSELINIRIEFLDMVGTVLRLTQGDAAEPQVFDENVAKLSRYLEELNLKVHDCKWGSLLITVECRSLEILEGLWQSYCSGNLNETAQKYLVTPEILNALDLAEVKLKTTILEEEYRAACQRFLAKKEAKTETADIPLSVTERDEKDVKPTASYHEEEEKTGKRKASLAFQDSDSKEEKKMKKEIRSAAKRMFPVVPPVQSTVKDADLTVDIVFALDCSSSISEENIMNQKAFVEHLAESLNVLPGSNCRAAVIAYADTARVVKELDQQPVILPPSLAELRSVGDVDCGENRRMDLALEKAAALFKSAGRSHIHQIVILITGGKQTSSRDRETNNDDIQSASNSLFSLGSQIVVIPVGMDIDFKELGLTIKRSQSMFSLLSFDDLEPNKADEIAREIRETMDLVPYTKRKVETFVDLRAECGYGEKIRDCLDVIEGIWYTLYEQKNSRRKTQMGKVEEVIRGGIDSFHSRLVSECSKVFSIAVFGPYGAGKSHFLNLLLNCDLPNHIKMPDGPLPSGEGESQTPLPIRVKYATKVNVFKHMRDVDHTVELYSADGLGSSTLVDINKCLKATFESSESVKDVQYIEVQGPFPIFQRLKERKVTSSGHLEVDVAVEIVDLPGIRQEKRSYQELNKADVILFFQSGRAKRPVSSEDIVQVFRHHDVFEFMSRPKLIHLNNFSRDNADVVYDESRLVGEKKNDLEKAWVDFFENENQGTGTCYTDAREKLPLLVGEDLLEKLKDESEVVILLQDPSASINSLKKAINRHIETVVVNKSTHSVLKDVLWMAIKLRAQLHARSAKEARKVKIRKVTVESKNFKILRYQRQAEELVDLFLSKDELHENGVPMEQALKTFLHRFLCSDEASSFLAKVLFRSLDFYSRNIINAVEDACISAFKDIPDGVHELAEMFCHGRVKFFCENSKDHLSNVLKKLQNQTFKRDIQDAEKQYTDICGDKEDRSAKKAIFSKFLSAVLEKASGSLEGRLRVKQQVASIPSFCEDLNRSVEALFDIKSLEDGARKPERLAILKNKLNKIIAFCRTTIRKVNPHPSLENVLLDHNVAFPEKMKPTSEDACKIPPRLGDDDLYRKITRCLDSKEPIKQLNKLLKIDAGILRPSTVKKETWAKVLVNVLCDDRHFDLDLMPDLKLDPKDEDKGRLIELARKSVFPYQKSETECKIVERETLPKDEIHVKQSSHQESALEAVMTTETRNGLHKITVAFTNPKEQVAPVFIPSIRPGPDPEMTGNFFLREDSWSLIGESGEEEGEDNDEIPQEEMVDVGEELPKTKDEKALDIFLVVEPEHLERVRSTLRRRPQAVSNINLKVVVLPKQRRGIGVVRAIIKTLAECFHFPLYWAIEDDLKCMFQFDENDRRWRKCSFVRGLLFGQRVFQDCLKSSVKELSADERLSFALEAVNKWPSWANETKKIALHLLMDGQQFSKVQCNPGLLEAPFTNERMKVDCLDDADKRKELEAVKQSFLDECHRRLFQDNINRIGSVSIAHEATRKSDFVTKYPSAHYRCKEGQYVVLYNTRALQLQKRNFVTDDVILSDEKFWESSDAEDRYWGTRGSSESFHRALSFKGVTSYQVICIVHSHKKSLTDAFEAHSGQMIH